MAVIPQEFPHPLNLLSTFTDWVSRRFLRWLLVLVATVVIVSIMAFLIEPRIIKETGHRVFDAQTGLTAEQVAQQLPTYTPGPALCCGRSMSAIPSFPSWRRCSLPLSPPGECAMRGRECMKGAACPAGSLSFMLVLLWIGPKTLLIFGSSTRILRSSKAESMTWLRSRTSRVM